MRMQVQIRKKGRGAPAVPLLDSVEFFGTPKLPNNANLTVLFKNVEVKNFSIDSRPDLRWLKISNLRIDLNSPTNLMANLEFFFCRTELEFLKFRVDCYPEPGATKNLCETRGCVWDACAWIIPPAPPCFYPAQSNHYAIVDGSNSSKILLGLMKSSPPPNRVQNLILTHEFFNDGTAGSTVHFKLVDADKPRYCSFLKKEA